MELFTGSTSAGVDHDTPSQIMTLPNASPATQNDTDAHDTDVMSLNPTIGLALSICAGADQEDPRHVCSLPEKSPTATQNDAVAQETEPGFPLRPLCAVQAAPFQVMEFPVGPMPMQNEVEMQERRSMSTSGGSAVGEDHEVPFHMNDWLTFSTMQNDVDTHEAGPTPPTPGKGGVRDHETPFHMSPSAMQEEGDAHETTPSPMAKAKPIGSAHEAPFQVVKLLVPIDMQNVAETQEIDTSSGPMDPTSTGADQVSEAPAAAAELAGAEGDVTTAPTIVPAMTTTAIVTTTADVRSNLRLRLMIASSHANRARTRYRQQRELRRTSTRCRRLALFDLRRSSTTEMSTSSREMLAQYNYVFIALAMGNPNAQSAYSGTKSMRYGQMAHRH